MTNTNEPRDPDQMPEEGAAETWQEETPPADDFHDAPEGDEAAAAEHDQAMQEAKKKSKGNLIFFGVLAVAALIVGGLAVTQLFKPQDSGLAGPSPAALAGGNPLNPASGVAGDSTVTPAAEQAAANALGVDPTVAPTNLTQASSNANMASALPEPTPSLPSAQPDLTGGQALPPALPPAVTTPASAQPSATGMQPVAPLGNAPVVTPPPANAAMEGRLSQLETQLLTLQQSMDRTAQDLSQISQRLNAMPVAASVANPDLEQKLNQLQQQVENMAARQPQVAPKSVSASKAEKSVSERRTAHDPSNRSYSRSTQSGKPSQKWVLRAATPDSAWVSAGANAPDLKRVAVGDSLPGIGKVKEIRQSGGQWQVIGTAGTVR